MSSYLILSAFVVVLAAAFVATKRRRAAARARDGVFAYEEQEVVRQQISRLLTDLQHVSREILKRTDDNIASLKQLLQQADARILELQRASEGSARNPRPAVAPTRPANPLHAQVYTLADGGLNATQICRETGLEKGEVELVLGLRRIPANEAHGP